METSDRALGLRAKASFSRLRLAGQHRKKKEGREHRHALLLLQGKLLQGYAGRKKLK